jgi:hypothetical protein
MPRAPLGKIPRHNVHDVHSRFCFRGLGHEHATFPHVHDVHDVHASDGYLVVKELIPLPRWAGGQAALKTVCYSLLPHLRCRLQALFFEKYSPNDFRSLAA